jgi:acyl-CoA thioester hydrolase
MRIFRCEIQLRWGDMDAMSHVNNVQYFRLLEEARIQWLAQEGISTLPTQGAPILASISLDFVRPLNYPGTAIVRQEVTRVGRSSLELALLIERSDEPETVYARGRSIIVWYDYEAGRSVPWPEALRQKFT